MSLNSQVARQFTKRGRNLPKPHEVRTHAFKEGRYPTAPTVQKMERIVLCLAVGLLCMGWTSAQQANATYASGNGTVAFVSGSASGSASGELRSTRMFAV